MIFKVLSLLFLSAVFCEQLREGDPCFKDGAEGVCLNLRQCRSAQEDIKKRIETKLCSYDEVDNRAPIVCCVEEPDGPVVDNNEDKCGPMPPDLTQLKTGRKAFDKCIEYQQKYVYPCGRATALTGTYSRQNNCHHKTDSLIIGGIDAEPYEFPHMALLGYGDSNIEWNCGGTIVSERFILTAGHCTYRKHDDPVTYVTIGALKRSDTNDRSKVYKVKNIIKHPDYKSPSKYNDIGLIETEKPMELSEFIVPACLHTGDYVNDTQVLATGWGNTQSDRVHHSEILQRVILSKFSKQICAKTYNKAKRHLDRGFDDLTMSCYGDTEAPQLYQSRFNQENKDTCAADSGGPIQIKNQKIHCMYTVVGVISFGKPKCGHDPAVYTRVAQYISWIESTVWPN